MGETNDGMRSHWDWLGCMHAMGVSNDRLAYGRSTQHGARVSTCGLDTSSCIVGGRARGKGLGEGGRTSRGSHRARANRCQSAERHGRTKAIR